jgi:1-acyl-sn-glycerol-3-phosphate acyltransferase
MIGNLRKIKEILISVFVWISGLSVFIPLGLIILLLSIFINPKHFDHFIKASCRIILRFLCIRIQVEGLDLFQTHQTYVFMSNHVNLFDVFVLYGYIPNFVRGIELDKHFDWPFYGLIIRRLGMISISHTNARSALKSLKRAKRAIADGTSIIILPEGGRTLDGKFKPFKRGSFLLAKEAGVDIVPLVMVGAYHIKQKGSLLIRPGKMALRFGEPISYQDIKDLEIHEIASCVQHRMSGLFNLHQHVVMLSKRKGRNNDDTKRWI